MTSFVLAISEITFGLPVQMADSLDYNALKELLFSQYVIPVVGVVLFVCFVYMLGFKRTVEPVFYYQPNDEKKRRHGKHRKVITRRATRVVFLEICKPYEKCVLSCFISVRFKNLSKM